MSACGRWTRDRDDPLHWRRWGQACFVFHEASGQTHFLNELGARILELIEEAPRSAGDVLAALSAEYGFDPDAELDEAVRRAVRMLDGLGLIRPHHP